MKNCPLCKRPTVVTFSLRPDNWPRAEYRTCNVCEWEEKDGNNPKKNKDAELNFDSIFGRKMITNDGV